VIHAELRVPKLPGTPIAPITPTNPAVRRSNGFILLVLITPTGRIGTSTLNDFLEDSTHYLNNLFCNYCGCKLL
jgi:hypothetical protein